ncbi:hypothetical protein GCM10023063_19340 [Arthrobacter methylotrophus]|uniref:Uncharacterized protein n=1 Tax=Arthrobacter methylotrophus TaxID=121291 RepID=A0ABV5UP97_9MICC
MSTKIHNGYRLAEGTNVFAFIRRVRAALDPVRDRVDGALLARLFTNAVDSCWLRGETVPPRLAFTAFNKWEDEQKKLADTARMKDPNRFEMCLGEDPETGRILVRLYTERTAMRDAFEAMGEVEPYSYWNNYDAPAALTEDQWEERRSAWERVMPDYAPPAETMLTFVLRTDANPGTLMLCSMDGGAEDPVLGRIPDRAESIVRTRYLHQLVTVNGIDVIPAFRHVGSERIGTMLAGLAAMIVDPHLWEITRELLLEGDPARTADPGALVSLQAACESLYEAEKATLPVPAGA